MAYMNQEKKKEIAALLKLAIPKSWKYSLSVNYHSTIILTVRSAPLDLIEIYTARGCLEDSRNSAIKSGHIEINPYHWQSHFEGELLQLFTVIFAAINLNNHNSSDSMTDYFDVGHYVLLQFGSWDKPFILGNK
jgi:hypothetical protein